MQNHSVLCVPWVTEVLFSPLRVEGCFGDGRKLRIFRLNAEATSGEANPVTIKFWTTHSDALVTPEEPIHEGLFVTLSSGYKSKEVLYNLYAFCEDFYFLT